MSFERRSGFISLYNLTTDDADTITASDLTVLESLSMAGVTWDMDQVDEVTITFDDNMLQVSDLGISTNKIANEAVTTAKISPEAVTGDKISPEAITTAKISPGAVTGDKIALETITGDKISPGAVTGDKIALGTITNAHISSSAAITDDKLAQITSADKVANSANVDLSTSTHLATGDTLVKRNSSGDAIFNDLHANSSLQTPLVITDVVATSDVVAPGSNELFLSSPQGIRGWVGGVNWLTMTSSSTNISNILNLSVLTPQRAVVTDGSRNLVSMQYSPNAFPSTIVSRSLTGSSNFTEVVITDGLYLTNPGSKIQFQSGYNVHDYKYEDLTTTMNMGGNHSGSITLKGSQIGRNVTVYLPPFTISNPSGLSVIGIITTSAAFSDSRFYPPHDMVLNATQTLNGSQTPFKFVYATNGIITVYSQTGGTITLNSGQTFTTLAISFSFVKDEGGA